MKARSKFMIMVVVSLGGGATWATSEHGPASAQKAGSAYCVIVTPQVGPQPPELCLPNPLGVRPQ